MIVTTLKKKISNQLSTWQSEFLYKALRSIWTQKKLSLQIDITRKCNLKCQHCYLPINNPSGHSDLDLSSWCKILDEYQILINKLWLEPEIAISGGEPFLSPSLIPLLKEIFHRWPKVQVFILSNGTIYDRECLEIVRDHKIGLQISIDGPDAKKHDFIRGEGRFNKTVQNIIKFQNLGIHIKCQSILSKRTAPFIKDFFILAQNLALTRFDFARFIPQGKGQEFFYSGKDAPLSPSELKAAMSEIIDCTKIYPVNSSTNAPLYHLLDPTLGGHSLFSFQGIIIDSRGNLKLSSRTDYQLGNVLEEGLEKLFFGHPLMKKLRSGRYDECKKCIYFSICGGDKNASYAEKGSFFKKDPGCWY